MFRVDVNIYVIEIKGFLSMKKRVKRFFEFGFSLYKDGIRGLGCINGNNNGVDCIYWLFRVGRGEVDGGRLE